MDIKLKARLSAYSKVDSVQDVTPEDIDSLFDETTDVPNKDCIDKLFSSEEK